MGVHTAAHCTNHTHYKWRLTDTVLSSCDICGIWFLDRRLPLWIDWKTWPSLSTTLRSQLLCMHSDTDSWNKPRPLPPNHFKFTECDHPLQPSCKQDNYSCRYTRLRIYSLFNDNVSNPDDKTTVTKWKGNGRKRTWRNLGIYLVICRGWMT